MKKLLLAVFFYLLWACATQTTPMGGPKDETPPVMKNSTPIQNQKNFKGQTVELKFNEDVILKNPKEEIIITPSPGKDIEFKAKGNTISIEPKNGWQDSTTYSINFREGIQDITEGNPAQNLRLAFSTGPIMDSLSISGSVKNMLNEKIPEAITVAIYSQDTFNIFQHTPMYFTKSNKKGEFKLDNLKEDTYYIYAFDDKNKNLKVDNNEDFAFIINTIELSSNKSGIVLSLIKVDTRPLKVTSTRSLSDLNTIRLNKPIKKYKLQSIGSKTPPNSFGENQSEIYSYLKEFKEDSIQLNLIALDSIQQSIDTTFFVKKNPSKREPEKFTVTFMPPILEKETGLLLSSFQSNKMITSFNLDSIRLMLDSTLFMNLKTENIHLDTASKKGNLSVVIDKSKLTNTNLFKLLLGKNFVNSIENDSIKSESLSVTTVSLEETGTLLLNVANKKNQPFIIELLTTSDKVVQTYKNQTSITAKYLAPETYKVRVTIDTNNNGEWDAGNFFKKIQPEQVFFLQNTDKKYEFPIRANWEVGPYTISF